MTHNERRATPAGPCWDATRRDGAIYSGGVDISGTAWSRAADNIGPGFAWLDGANTGIDRTRVAEACYRLVLDDTLAVSADLQYMKDELDSGPDATGFICGMRATLAF